MTSGNHRAPARRTARERGGCVGGLALDALNIAARSTPGRMALEIAAATDHNWFAQHPSRATYVRTVLDGEFADAAPAADWIVAVRKLSDGDFARAYFPCPDNLTEPTARVLALLVDGVFERISERRSVATA